MIKLILVDDEEEVRKGILQKIDWGAIGFEIAGEAENGMEALEIVERTVPDVVITDIKMPFMDGLALSEKLHHRFPATKIIILTGFDEFDYAQRAIKLGVVEYILKPISSVELIDVLDRVKLKINMEAAQRKDMEALREHYRKSLPLLRDKFLGSLVSGNLTREEIEGKSKSYQVDLKGSGFAAAVIKIDLPSAAGSFNLLEDKELIEFAVLNISGEIIARYGRGNLFLHNDGIVVLFLWEEGDRESGMGKVMEILEEIRQNIEAYLKLTVTIGAGSFCREVSELRHSFATAVAALDYSLILGKNRVIWIEDMEPQNTAKLLFDPFKERSLIGCIKVGTADEIVETVEDLLREIQEGRVSFQDCRMYLLEILTSILKVARDLQVDMDKLFGSGCNLFVEIFRLKDIREVREWLLGICTKIRGYISKERFDSCKLLVNRAVEYIGEHYSENDTTIDKVCKYLHISPTYFSTIFKRETRQTFGNYLTQTRLEAARELLRATGLKTFDIARRVGYSEPNYFSYCFKKNLGISPSEYRSSIESGSRELKA
jgi:two-component system, response regulator YesN